MYKVFFKNFSDGLSGVGIMGVEYMEARSDGEAISRYINGQILWHGGRRFKVLIGLQKSGPTGFTGIF